MDNESITASLADLKKVFTNHYKYHLPFEGVACVRESRSEQAMSSQYSGRVAFELLQNALDRSNETIVVMLSEKGLLVANDGRAVTYDCEFDYKNPPGLDKYSDFNSLCSMNTSNKSADEDIGNKGVGFRSVFDVSNQVQVWSKLKNESDSIWWGFELHEQLDRDIYERRIKDFNIKSGMDELLDLDNKCLRERLSGTEKIPSFYFPLPLLNGSKFPLADSNIDRNLPLDKIDKLVTLIFIPIADTKGEKHTKTRAGLEKAFKELRECRFHFIGLHKNKEKRKIRIGFLSPEAKYLERSAWPDLQNNDNWSISQWRSEGLAAEGLAKLAKEAHLSISKPGVGVAWPPKGHENKDDQTKIYCYLPTKVQPGIPFDIHADFQLAIDRVNLDLDTKDTGEYNKALLEAAAELHISRILEELSIEPEGLPFEYVKPGELKDTHFGRIRDNDYPRTDIWRLLNPDGSAIKELKDFLAGLLFDKSKGTACPQCYSRWADLAKAFFNSSETWPLESYREFWSACEYWIGDLSGVKGKDTGAWQNGAVAMCDALRTKEACVAPLTTYRNDESEDNSKKEVKGFPLPTRTKGQPSGQKASRRLFLIKKESENENINKPLPRLLIEANRALTSFDFPWPFVDGNQRAIGAIKMDRWTVLQEFRQLPSDTENLKEIRGGESADAQKMVDAQKELIQFAAALFAINFTKSDPKEYPMGWRAHNLNSPYGEDERKAGRALATLFLPTQAGKWEPARQLTLDQIDDSKIGDFAEGISKEAFFLFLGVAPRPSENCLPLRLIEGGAQGVITPLEHPPKLYTARDSKSPPLRLYPEPDGDQFDSVKGLQAVQNSWDWLETLIDLEKSSSESNHLEIYKSLSSESWFPIGGISAVEAPEYATSFKGKIKPELVAILHPSDRKHKVMWSIKRQSDQLQRKILEKLNAVTDFDEMSAESALKMIRHIRENLDLEKVQINPQTKEAIIEAFTSLFNAITKNENSKNSMKSEHFPLLVYEESEDEKALSDRKLKWVDENFFSTTAWLTQDVGDMEILRRFFPSEPLVVCHIGKKTVHEIKWLKQKFINVESVVMGEDEPMTESSPLVENLRQKLENALPGLLALSQTNRQNVPDPNTCAKRWRHLKRKITHVRDAWIKHTVTGEGLNKTKKHLQGPNNDVLFIAKGSKNEPEDQIIFDVREGEKHPPLDEFGEALANTVAKNKGLGFLFSHALARFDQSKKAFEELLEKEGAVISHRAYARALKPLDKQELRDYKVKLVNALRNAGVQLKDPDSEIDSMTVLGPNELELIKSDQTDIGEDNIEAEMKKQDWTEAEKILRPIINVSGHNKRIWSKWLEENDMKERLLTYAQSKIVQNEDDDLKTKLNGFVEEACKTLCFCPESSAFKWLSSLFDSNSSTMTARKMAFTQETLVDELKCSFPEYQAVTEYPSPSSEWEAKRIGPHAPVSQEKPPITNEDRKYDSEVKGALGNAAEMAFLHYVVNKTHECLKKYPEEGWNQLFSAIPQEGKTNEEMRKAKENWEKTQNDEELKSALGISSIWGNAGFDIIGLETDVGNGKPFVVRYECKATPANCKGIRIFITSNELNVFRCVLKKGDNFNHNERYQGRWKLIAIQPNGKTNDITSHLEELVNNDDKYLDPLREKGFEPNGLILSLGRSQNIK